MCLGVYGGLLFPHSFKVLQCFKGRERRNLQLCPGSALIAIISSVAEGREVDEQEGEKEGGRAEWEKSKL